MRAYRDLAVLVRHLADELAGFRRRALTAEAELRAAGAPADESPAGATSGLAAPEPAGIAHTANARIAELERENAELRRRLEVAGTRTRTLLDRVRFLRQQHVLGG